jgi:kynurenine formamidase
VGSVAAAAVAVAVADADANANAADALTPGSRGDGGMRHDLSQPIETGTPTYPGDPAVSVVPHATFEADGYRVSELVCGTHAGTHVDAPSHTEPEGASLGAFPVERFRFDAVRADVTGRDPRSRIGPAALPDAAVAADADLLVVHTGWDDRWGTDAYLDHPFLAPAAAEWCVENGLDVAVDAASPDPTPTPRAAPDEPGGFPAHRALLGAGRLVLENLRGLAAVPDRFTLHAYPLAVDADGAPVRAVAEG